MSFSAVTKNELARVLGSRPCCRIAELAALVKMDGKVLTRGEHRTLQLHTENAAVARKVFTLLKGVFDLNADVTVQRKTRLRKRNLYLVRVPPQADLAEVLRKIGLIGRAGGAGEIVRNDFTRRECCRRAYLRGAFLGGGSVNSPEGTYHLEIVAGSIKHAGQIERLMQKFELAARVSVRKNRYVVYLKESEQIVSFLNIIGAHEALFNYENARIFKEVRNNVNRKVNCETANLNKTVNAAVRQLENINLVRERVGLSNLPDPLREAAELRLNYPDVSLKELGDLCDPRLGKSGINHRLRKLDDIAEKIRSGGSLS